MINLSPPLSHLDILQTSPYFFHVHAHCLATAIHQIVFALRIKVRRNAQRTTNLRVGVHRCVRGNEMIPRAATCPRASNKSVFTCRLCEAEKLSPCWIYFWTTPCRALACRVEIFFVSPIFGFLFQKPKKFRTTRDYNLSIRPVFVGMEKSLFEVELSPFYLNTNLVSSRA